MADTTRTFLALAIPDDRRAKLGRLQSLIAPEMPGTRWVDPARFHATLAFLADVPHADLGRVRRAVAEACPDRGPRARWEINREAAETVPYRPGIA